MLSAPKWYDEPVTAFLGDRGRISPRAKEASWIAALALALLSISATVELVRTRASAEVALPSPVIKAGDLFQRVRLYNNPQLSNDNGLLILEGDASPDGVAFDFRTTPGMKYELVIRGNPVEGATSR